MSERDETPADVSRGAWPRPSIALLTLVLVAPAVRFRGYTVHRHLTLDDGAYGLSIFDMRHGLVPYRDLFSSQGPLHYPLLYAGSFLEGDARIAPRVVCMFSGVAITIAMYALARRLDAPPRRALVVGLLAATTGSLLWVTTATSADGPAIAFTVAACWAAVATRDRPRVRTALLTGVLFGAALATKPLVFPAAIAIGWWLWSRRRVASLLAAVGAAIAVWLAAALPWGLSRVWDQSIRFHTEKSAQSGPLTQLGKLVTTLVQRDLVLLGFVAVVVVALVVRRAGDASVRTDSVVVTAWIAVTIVVLVFEKLLLVSHVATLAPPLLLFLALRPPPRTWLVAAAVVLVPVQAYQLSDIVFPPPYRGRDAQVVAALRALPRDSHAIADITGLVWQAGLTSPPMLNDNSAARIETGAETVETVIAGARDSRTCAVVIWSFRYGTLLPGLRDALRDAGYELAHTYGDQDHQLWLTPRCRAALARDDRTRATAELARSPR